MNKRKWFGGLVVLLLVAVFATGIGFLNMNDNGKLKLLAAGDGTAASPYEINGFTAFSNMVPDMARPGTAANPTYFKITAPIDMGGLNPTFTRTLANHVIIDGQGFELSNLNSSLFSNVIGPNSVIKNINFSGTGNIAHEFSGIMDNVNHVSGSVFNLNGTSVGGLVNFAENATFRYCSNAATIRRSTAESSAVSNGGIIGVSSGTLYMTNTSNSGLILTMGTVESSGGLIGKVTGGGNALVELSFNTGVINGQRSGGLIGKMEGTGTLDIKESYNTGRVSNRDRLILGSESPSAGILAWATGGTVNIESCYNKGNVRIGNDTSDTTTRSENSAGIFGLNGGASVSIKRTYNTGISQHAIAVNTSSNVTNNYVLSGTYTTLGTGVTQATQAVLRSTSTVDALNTGLDSPVYRLASGTSENEGYPVLVGEAYRFNANGGIMITEDGPVDSLRFNQDELTQIKNEMEGSGGTGGMAFDRFAFEFVGWSTNAQAQPGEQAFFDYWDALTVGGGTYYAVWKAVEYKINFVLSDDFTDRQTYAANYTNGNASKVGNDWVFVIGQNIYLQTSINALPLDYFVGWQVKLPDADVFTPFSKGFRPALPVTEGVLTERLDLYENDISIIDEDFINTFVDEATGTVTLMAVFASGQTYEMLVDATTYNSENIRQAPSHTYRSWGTLRISYTSMVDSTPHLTTYTTTFPKGERFAGTKEYTVSVKPHEHYRLVGFELMAASDLSTVTTIGAGAADTDGFYTYTNTYGDNYVVYAILEPIKYNITVVAKTTDGNDITVPADLAGLVMKGGISYDGTAAEVILNDVFSGITLGSNEKYKMISLALDNFRIYNQKTGDYDKRSTNTAGAINIQVNSAFLTKYADSGNNIEIEALFVELVRLQVDITTPDLGTVSVDVRDGTSHYPIRQVTYLDQSFGIGSSVTINLEFGYQVYVKSVIIYDEFNVGTNSDTKLQTIKFNLDAARRVVIEYDIRAYSMDFTVIDGEGDRFPEYPLPSIDVTVDGNPWVPTIGLGLDSVISFEKESSEVWEDEWVFVGWFLIYGDNKSDEIYGNPLDELNLTNDYAVTINDDFIRDYLSENVNFVIEARFLKIFNVTVGIGLDNSGGAKTVSGGNLVGLTKHSANEKLMIRLAPAEFYSVAKIEGLLGSESIQSDNNGEYVLIDVTGERYIHITYQPEQKDVVNIFASSSGKVKINTSQLGIGTTVVLQFKPKTGYQRDTWKINGISVDDIKSEFEGSNAKVSGDMISFKITHDWYREFGSTLDSDVKVVLNTFLVIGIAGIAVIVPLLLIGTVLMMRANKKRKAEYAIALQKTKEAKARMGFVDSIKNARGE